MRDEEIRVEAIDYHRNSVSGEGFHIVLFRWKDRGERRVHNMVGIVFAAPETDCGTPPPENGRVAVLDRDLLHEGNIKFGRGNSWRGDYFEGRLRAAIAKHYADEEAAS